MNATLSPVQTDAFLLTNNTPALLGVVASVCP